MFTCVALQAGAPPGESQTPGGQRLEAIAAWLTLVPEVLQGWLCEPAAPAGPSCFGESFGASSNAVSFGKHSLVLPQTGCKSFVSGYPACTAALHGGLSSFIPERVHLLSRSPLSTYCVCQEVFWVPGRQEVAGTVTCRDTALPNRRTVI